MGNPETLPVEERARKLLAAQYQRDHPDRAKRILAGASDKAAVDAVVTALSASQQQLAEAVEVLTKILDGFVPRPLGKRWRADGQPSKFDECIHSVSMGQDCGRCTDDMISDFLTKHRREG